MKFQDSSFNGLKVTVGTKSVTHPRTHALKAICPINFFKVGGITTPNNNKNGRSVSSEAVYNHLLQAEPRSTPRSAYSFVKICS